MHPAQSGARSGRSISSFLLQCRSWTYIHFDALEGWHDSFHKGECSGGRGRERSDTKSKARGRARRHANYFFHRASNSSLTFNHLPNPKRNPISTIYQKKGSRVGKKATPLPETPLARLAARLAPNAETERWSHLTFKQFFAQVTPQWDYPQHLGPFLSLAESIADNDAVGIRATISVGPQHGKSSLALNLVLFLALQKPGIKIMYCTYNEDLARHFQAECDRVFLTLGIPWGYGSKTQHVWDFPNSSSIYWTAMGGSTTGKHADLIVVDDLIKGSADANSKAFRDSAWDFYCNSLESRLQASGNLLFIGTRWHVDDPQGRLKAQDDATYQHINIQSIQIGEDGKEVALWEASKSGKPMQTLESLLIKRKRNEFNFSCLYQGEPRSKGSRVFEPIQTYQTPPNGARITLGLDLAYSSKSSADFSVAVAIATVTEADGHYSHYLIDMLRGRWRLEALVPLLRDFQERHQVPFLIDTGPTERGILDLMRPYGLRISGKPARVDKFMRAQPFAQASNRGNFFFPSTSPHIGAIREELESFSGTDADPHDDIVDAISSAFSPYVRQKTTSLWAQSNTLGIW
jgi:predicted phage terminase large subunit-like protein